jgi:hypothetical protein
MIIDVMQIEFLGWGNARVAWNGDPDLVAHIFVNGVLALAPQYMGETQKSVVIGLPDPFLVEIHEVAEGVEVVPVFIPLERKPLVWWSARTGAEEYRVHHRADGGLDSVIGGILQASDALHYEFRASSDLRKDGKRWGFLHVEAVNALGKKSVRPEWPLFMASLPDKPTGLDITGEAGVFDLALEV